MEHNLRPPGDSKTTAQTVAVDKAAAKNTNFLLMFAAAVALLLVVVLVLPAMVPEPGSKDMAPVPESAHPPRQQEPLSASANEKLKIDAEQALQSFLRLQAHPDLNNAETWSVNNWQTAMDTADQGDDEFGRGNFSAALNAYQQAGANLQSILDTREETLEQSLVDGWQHLQNNAVENASTDFQRVIAMQADHQQAQSGLDRAAVRYQVLEVVEEGQQAETSARLQDALQAYLSALMLDLLFEPAQQGLQRVENELTNLAFQDAMGRALSALDESRFASAEKALNEAAGIKPNDPSIKDIRQRLLVARRQDRLMTLRAQSKQRVSNEDWTGASQTYREALSIDPKASFAVIGLSRAQEKQRVHQQLDHYLADTTRLFSDEPLNNARRLLEANQQTPADEPQLAEKLVVLQQAVELAVIPVKLLLLSDNLTEVTIYKVGRLGSFEQKQMSLRPGKYTVTGSRQGYRDVLKVIELKPGTAGLSLDIRSEDSI